MRPFYKLRVRFAECEITQNEVARRAGIAASTMTCRMNGQQPFDAWQMDAIGQILGIPREEYFLYFFESKRKAAPGATNTQSGKAVKFHQVTASIIHELEEKSNEI